jgi:hypothetical protein
MKKSSILYFFLFLVSFSKAQPDPNTAQRIGNVTVWADNTKAGTYYYLPGSIELAKEKNGQPAVKLLLLRYTGTTINKDVGLDRNRNILQMRLKLINPPKDELARLKSTLRARDLFVLPVSRLQSTIILPSLSGTDTASASNGYFEQINAAVNNSYWDERDYTLKLDNYTAQFVKAQLDSNKLLMSLAYAFFVTTPVKIDTGRYSGYGLINSRVNFERNSADSVTTVIAKADALAVYIDIKQWPDIVTKVDINERLPPAYPCLDIYCFDFNNEIRKDLYAKRVEIKAKGIANDEVIYTVQFKSATPDIYAASVKFKYAVRMDLPFYFRVTEINNEGESVQKEWIKQDNWYDRIDITSLPKD